MPTVIISSGETCGVASGQADPHDSTLGGTTRVVSAGDADLTKVDGGGSEVVSVGGTYVGAQLSGGERDAAGYAGGTMALGVNKGGVLDVLLGGLAGGAQAFVGGLNDENISVGGTDLAALVAGGAQEAFGHAGGAQHYLGGQLQANPGGTANAPVVGGGGLLISSGDTASGATPLAGFDEMPGAAVGTTIDGGTEYDREIAPGAQVDGGGPQVVEPGALAVGSLAISGATLVVGGTPSGTTPLVGDFDLVHGPASSTTIDTGVSENSWKDARPLIGSGDTASGAAVARGGVDQVLGGAMSTRINGGGIEDDGAVAGGSLVDSGGQRIVEAAGPASATAVMAAGDLFVGAGGAASGATVAGGGFDQVRTNIIDSGGVERDDGVARATTVDSGGQQNILIFIGASDTTVLGGGVEHAVAGATALATTISGGFIEVNAGGSGGLVASASGGTPQPDDPVHLGGFVAGSGAPELLNLADITFSSGMTLPAGTPSGAGGALVVPDGAHMAPVSQPHVGADRQVGTAESDPSSGGPPI